MVGIGRIKRIERGLSLIEAMLSLLVMLAAVTGLAAAFQNRIFQTVSMKNQSTASMIAQSVAAEMMATDPALWDASELEGNFTYTFDGERIEGEGTPYYWVDISWSQEANWYQVEIGVLWSGWRSEAEKDGLDTEDIDFAYILDVSMAPAYGDVASP